MPYQQNISENKYKIENMDAKYMHPEMEPFGKDNLNEIGVPKKKWRFVKPCIKCIVLVVVVGTVLLLAHSINNLGNKLQGKNLQTEDNQPVSLPEALKSSKIGMSLLDKKFLMNSEFYDNSDYVGRFKPGTGIPDSDAEQESVDDEAYLKHYLGIGMREDKMMQDCQNSQMKHSFQDIDYALLGYDIFNGFPLAEGHDPGFTYPVFTADYSHGHMTADCRYSVPKGFVVFPDVSCVTSFSSDIIQKTEELTRSLSFNAGVNGGGFGVEFSASTGYSQVSKDLTSSNFLYIISTAHCNYYVSKFKKENPPPFSEMFFNWIHKLNNSTDDVVLDFFDTFGTHYPKEVTFGARFSYQHKMNSTLFKSERKKGMNVAAQASYSGMFSVGGGFSLTAEQREEASNFSKSVETKTITVGAAPPANGDALTWASTVQNNPVPARYELEPIENLFHDRFMGHLHVDFRAIASKLKKMKMKYYNRLIAKKYKIEIEKQSNRWITKTLSFDNGGRYGTWQPAQFCPIGTFSKGFSLKERRLANMFVEGVRLVCADKLGQPPKDQRAHEQSPEDNTGSPEDNTGNWAKQIFCPQGTSDSTLFLHQFALKIQEKDDMRSAAVNGIKFSCRDLAWKKHSYANSPFAQQIATWSEKCPLGSAICGIQTHIQNNDTNIQNNGNDILNDIRFYCCGDDSAYLGESVIF